MVLHQDIRGSAGAGGSACMFLLCPVISEMFSLTDVPSDMSVRYAWL